MLAAAAAVVSLALPPTADRLAIREAHDLVVRYGDALWPDYAKAPFYVDYIQADQEVMFCRPPAASFSPLGVDPVTNCNAQARPRKFAVDLAASTSEDDGPPMIEIGTPATLGLRRTDWMLTLVHEDFHQYQSTLPAYQAAVARMDRRLGASGGGPSWMLDYPFPYADLEVGKAFAAMSTTALAFLEARSTQEQVHAIHAYVAARRALTATAGADSTAYLEFQIGQEGVARWTEGAVALAASRQDAAFAAAANDRKAGLAVSLRAIDRQGLRVWKRSVFYVLGPIEIEMLEALGRPWRSEYLRDPFAFGDQLTRGGAADALCR